MREKFKMLVTDIDGTILNYGAEDFSLQTKAAFRALKKQKIVTVLASGREMVTIKDLHYRLDVDYFIGANGSFVYDLKAKKYIIKKFPSFASAWKYSQDLLKNNFKAHFTFTDENNIFISYQNSSAKNWFLRPFCSKFIEYRSLADLEALDPNTFALLTVTSLNPHALTFSQKWLAQDNNLEISARWSSGWFIQRKGVNKYTTALALAQLLKIKNEQIITFGDRSNDYQLVKFSGHGVAMANSTPDLLEATKNRALGVSEDGFFKYLKAHKII